MQTLLKDKDNPFIKFVAIFTWIQLLRLNAWNTTKDPFIIQNLTKPAVWRCERPLFEPRKGSTEGIFDRKIGFN
jgi:hypothetical protein